MVFGKTTKITITLILIFSIIITGCIDYGDIKTSIDKWNVIIVKNQQLKLLDTQYGKIIESDNAILEAELAKETPNMDIVSPFLDKWKKMFDEERKLLEEESSLISDFAGTTAKLNEDAKKYADGALLNIRESNRYDKSTIDNSYSAIESLRTCVKNLDMSYCSQSEQYFKAADSDSSKSEFYANKANDEIKKLEALQ